MQPPVTSNPTQNNASPLLKIAKKLFTITALIILVAVTWALIRVFSGIESAPDSAAYGMVVFSVILLAPFTLIVLFSPAFLAVAVLIAVHISKYGRKQTPFYFIRLLIVSSIMALVGVPRLLFGSGEFNDILRILF